jgi:hypothetical protein
MYNNNSVRRALLALVSAGALAVTGLGVAGAASTVPSGAKKVTVTAGGTHHGINATLPTSGAIDGKITVKGSGKAVPSVVVSAYDTKGSSVGFGFADQHGKYHIYGLDTGKYRVCVVGPPGPGSAYKFGLSPGCIGSNQAPSFFGIPKDAKEFSVHRGSAQHGNLALPKAGAISGAVKSSSGKKLSHVEAEAFSRGQAVKFAETNGSGAYEVDGLTPGTYKVCFFPENSGAATTNTTTGVLRQCWKNAGYNGTKLPSSAKSVKVKAGKKSGGINASMRTAGAISGKVTSSTNHKVLQGTTIDVYQGTHYYASASTNNKGKYIVKDLPAGSFKVCALGGGESNGKFGSTSGRCYANKPFKNFKPSASAKSVSVKIGKTHRNINMKLPTKSFPQGSISGKLTGPGGVAIVGATVEAEGVGGGFASTDANGKYTITNLLVGKYTVCFNPGQFAQPSSGTAPATGYSSVCYKTVKWDGGSTSVPSGAAKVTVRANKTAKNVNASVGKGGAIAGTVKLAGGGSGFVEINVLDAKGDTASSMESGGDYSVNALTPSSTGYAVCVSAVGVNSNPPNHLGYVAQCYKNKTWKSPGFSARPRQTQFTHHPLALNRRTGQWLIRK